MPDRLDHYSGQLSRRCDLVVTSHIKANFEFPKLSNWFINARRRELPEMDRQAKAKSMARHHDSPDLDEI